MVRISYDQFKKLLERYDKFDENVLLAMQKEFGKSRINLYFDRLFHEVDVEKSEELSLKYAAYFEQDMSCEDNSDKVSSSEADVVSSIFNSAARYEVMSIDFEKEQGFYLKEGNDRLKVLSLNDDVLFPDLDLAKIFVSIRSMDQLELLRKVRRLPFVLRNESIFKDQRGDMKKYLNMCLNGIPSLEELAASFPNLDFNVDEVMSVEEYNDQMELLIRYVTAKNNFYNRNLKLVISIAKKNQYGSGLPFEDIIEEGNLGLIKAVNRYDASWGNKFSTYAIWWIRQSICRAYADKSNIIRKPVHYFEKLVAYKSFVNKYFSENNCEPSVSEIADGMGISENAVLDLIFNNSDIISLETPVINNDGDSDNYLGDFIPADNVDIAEEVMSNIFCDEVMGLLSSNFNKRENEILRCRMGLNSEQKVYTLQEVGEKLGITRERVRQIEGKSLKRLKKLLKKKNYTSYRGD